MLYTDITSLRLRCVLLLVYGVGSILLEDLPLKPRSAKAPLLLSRASSSVPSPSSSRPSPLHRPPPLASTCPASIEPQPCPFHSTGACRGWRPPLPASLSLSDPETIPKQADKRSSTASSVSPPRCPVYVCCIGPSFTRSSRPGIAEAHKQTPCRGPPEPSPAAQHGPLVLVCDKPAGLASRISAQYMWPLICQLQ